VPALLAPVTAAAGVRRHPSWRAWRATRPRP